MSRISTTAAGGPPAPEEPRYGSFQVMDMHTGGEPVRIVRRGYPSIPGATILEKRRYTREHLDHLRQFLMFEPRGHADMYGAVLVEPCVPDADLAVLFLHNEGYSTMCGHAVIALGRYAVDQRLVQPEEPVTRVRIECPCGVVEAAVEVRDGVAERVSFESVPAFLFADGVRVEVPGYGTVTADVSYGGAFYALAPAHTLGLDVRTSRMRDVVDAATALTEAVRAAVPLSHPEHDELAFLYGSILTDGRERPEEGPSRNICVFADAEVDRSPTGSGVTARMAARVAHGSVGLGEPCVFESVTGAQFEGEALAKTRCGDREAVTVQVSGQAYYSGEARFWLDEGDMIGRGFLLR
jgi:trans-L-3-hydroxyproline dehydratase